MDSEVSVKIEALILRARSLTMIRRDCCRFSSLLGGWGEPPSLRCELYCNQDCPLAGGPVRLGGCLVRSGFLTVDETPAGRLRRTGLIELFP
jgi:hypothetical protein